MEKAGYNIWHDFGSVSKTAWKKISWNVNWVYSELWDCGWLLFPSLSFSVFCDKQYYFYYLPLKITVNSITLKIRKNHRSWQKEISITWFVNDTISGKSHCRPSCRGFLTVSRGTGHLNLYPASLKSARTVKNLPERQETQVRSLGREEPLEKGMVTYSSILAWRNPRTAEPGGLQSTESQRVSATNTCTFFTS